MKRARRPPRLQNGLFGEEVRAHEVLERSHERLIGGEALVPLADLGRKGGRDEDLADRRVQPYHGNRAAKALA